MPSYDPEEAGSGDYEKVKPGYYTVGPPWDMGGGFEPNKKVQGLTSAILKGTIKGVLSHTLGAEKHVATEEMLGHQVPFFISQPMKNYVIRDGAYIPLDTRVTDWGALQPNFWLKWVLTKAGASMQDLTMDDDERLGKEILALLNSGSAFPVGVWPSGWPSDIDRQIPSHKRVLATFDSLQLYDDDAKRPAWVEYETTNQKGDLVTMRDVFFLFRVVTGEWLNNLVRIRLNYTVRRGETSWTLSHKKAVFATWCNTLGVDFAHFTEDVNEDLFYEVEVGGIPNLLGPLQDELKRCVERGYYMRIDIPDNGRANRECVNAAGSPDILELAGTKDFTPPPLRLIADIPEEEIERVGEAEPIPGFDDPLPSPSMPVSQDDIRLAIDAWEGGDDTIWADNKGKMTEAGRAWAKTYLLPVYQALGLDPSKPLEGWTGTKRAQAVDALTSSDYKAMCEKRAVLTDKTERAEAMAAIVDYLENLWVEPDPTDEDYFF